LKVLHVTPSFYPATYYGGPIYSTYALCNALAANPEIELRVLTTNTAGLRRAERLSVNDFPSRMPAGYDVYYCKRWAGADIAPGLVARLWGMIRWADVVHLTAVYSPPSIPTLLLCSLLRKPVVWSTRGALQPWSRSLRKNIWDKMCNSLCRPDRVVLHATSDAESRESLKRLSHTRSVVIPNGIDVPVANGSGPTKAGELRLLYLGRLHPIKGLENLLRAMARLPGNMNLSICGDGVTVYRKQLEALTSKLGLSARVTFRGQVEGETKEQCFTEADWCVVPSFQENFCVVVAEALARGVPVIASRGTPWSRLEEMGCGLWVDNDEASLAEAITRAAKMPRREMGRRGREWMKREFSWPIIAEQMVAQYRELVESNQPVSERGAVATRSKPNLNGRSRRYRSGF